MIRKFSITVFLINKYVVINYKQKLIQFNLHSLVNSTLEVQFQVPNKIDGAGGVGVVATDGRKGCRRGSDGGVNGGGCVNGKKDTEQGRDSLFRIRLN